MNHQPSPEVALAIALNNEGLDSLEDREYEKSIDCIGHALAMVKVELSFCSTGCNSVSSNNNRVTHGDCCPSRRNNEGNGASPSMSEAQCFMVSHHFHELETGTIKGGCMSHEGWNEIFVFDQPIHVSPPSPSPVPMRCHKYLTSLAFVLLFNLALAHHLYAMEQAANPGQEGTEARTLTPTSQCPRRLLMKAIRLYEMAYLAQESEDAIHMTALENMAIVNNLGQIHTILDNQKASEHCFQHLWKLMTFVSQSGNGNDDARLYFEDFLANVSPVIIANPKPAAAA